MKKIIHNTNGSSGPIIIFIFCLAIVSFLVLIIGFVIEPFMNLMASTDDDIDSDISLPRVYVSQFVQIIWPKGVLLVVFLALSGALIMEYQKSKYQKMG